MRVVARKDRKLVVWLARPPHLSVGTKEWFKWDGLAGQTRKWDAFVTSAANRYVRQSVNINSGTAPSSKLYGVGVYRTEHASVMLHLCNWLALCREAIGHRSSGGKATGEQRPATNRAQTRIPNPKPSLNPGPTYALMRSFSHASH